MILVTTYTNPDLDGFAAAIAYVEFLDKTGKSAVAGFFGDYQPEVKFVANRFSLALSQPINDATGFEQIILVDVSDLKRLDKSIDPRKVIEIIDHREVFDLASFPNAKSQIEVIGAAATLVGKRLNDLKQFEFTGKNIAIALLETIDASVLVKSRQQEILAKLTELKRELASNYIFLMVVDMEKLITIFVCKDVETQDLLKTILGLDFKDNVAKSEKSKWFWRGGRADECTTLEMWRIRKGTVSSNLTLAAA